MSVNKNIFDKNLYFDFQNNVSVNGLEDFQNSLEKHFFCSSTIRSYVTNEKIIHLVIELSFNFDFLETLFYKKKNVLIFNNGEQINAFNDALAVLQTKNQLTIDIEELSVYLNDTSFIIHKIYEQSISKQIGKIVNSICDHYTYFSEELSKMPNEVFIPVYSEEQTEENKYSPESVADAYYKYWCLYYEDQVNSSIYDLDKKLILTNSELLLHNPSL